MLLPQWLNYFIVFCGTLACQNGPLKWVAQHRMHHEGSDTDNDPHNASRGFWWSHIGWMCYDRHKFDNVNRMRKYTQDINRDTFYQFLDKYFIHIQIALGIIFFLLGGISWVVWGIFVRLVLVYHATWLVNSACHMWGYTNYNINDKSKNNWWVALLTFGEGWHSNHHKLPRSAKHGLKLYELDLTYCLIYSLYKIGLINDLKLYKL
jgi:stearoyl-CoA desaturase (delta-9 desaturase)